GGQDELVFDGGSLVMAPDGTVVAWAERFEEDLLVVDLGGAGRGGPAWPEGPAEVCRAIELGVRDYVRKNGFREVAIGLSGGIDSALVATIAGDALGPGGVRALAMPSTYSSPGSIEDAIDVARRLDIRLDTIEIPSIVDAYRAALADVFAGTEEGVAEEN